MTIRNRNTLTRMWVEAGRLARLAEDITRTAKPLAVHIAEKEQELKALCEAIDAASTEAEDLRELVKRECAEAGWEPPALPAEPPSQQGPEDAGAGADPIFDQVSAEMPGPDAHPAVPEPCDACETNGYNCSAHGGRPDTRRTPAAPAGEETKTDA